MVLKLVGIQPSPYVKTAAAVLKEKNVPFEFVEIDFIKGEHKTPAYLEKHPFGQLPYLDHDGFIVYESRAIARYIEENFPNQGTKLIPTDPKAKALFEQAASVEQNNFSPYASVVVIENVFKPKYAGIQPDAALAKEKLDILNARLDVYDQILAKQKYVAGDEITLADFFHLAFGSLLPAAGCDAITSRPNVARWFNEISSRPSWQAVKDGIESSA